MIPPQVFQVPKITREVTFPRPLISFWCPAARKELLLQGSVAVGTGGRPRTRATTYSQEWPVSARASGRSGWNTHSLNRKVLLLYESRGFTNKNHCYSKELIWYLNSCTHLPSERHKERLHRDAVKPIQDLSHPWLAVWMSWKWKGRERL